MFKGSPDPMQSLRNSMKKITSGLSKEPQDHAECMRGVLDLGLPPEACPLIRTLLSGDDGDNHVKNMLLLVKVVAKKCGACISDSPPAQELAQNVIMPPALSVMDKLRGYAPTLCRTDDRLSAVPAEHVVTEAARNVGLTSTDPDPSAIAEGLNGEVAKLFNILLFAGGLADQMDKCVRTEEKPGRKISAVKYWSHWLSS